MSVEGTKIPSIAGRLSEMLGGKENGFPVEMFTFPVGVAAAASAVGSGMSALSDVAHFGFDSLGGLTSDVKGMQLPMVAQSLDTGFSRSL